MGVSSSNGGGVPLERPLRSPPGHAAPELFFEVV